MPSSATPELPTGWTPVQHGRIRLLAAGVTVLGLFLFLMSSVGLATDAWPFAAAGLTFAVLLGVAAYNLVRHQSRTPRSLAPLRCSEDPPSLDIAYSRAVLVVRLASLVLGGSGAVLWGIAAWSVGNELLAVLSTLVGVACLGVLLRNYVRGIRRGTLRLSVDTFRLQVDDQDVSVPWSGISSIRTWEAGPSGLIRSRRITVHAEAVGGVLSPQARTSRGPVHRPSTRQIEIECDLIDVDPVLMIRLLDFYLRHPAARSELGTPASLDRAERFSH